MIELKNKLCSFWENIIHNYTFDYKTLRMHITKETKYIGK